MLQCDSFCQSIEQKCVIECDVSATPAGYCSAVCAKLKTKCDAVCLCSQWVTSDPSTTGMDECLDLAAGHTLVDCIRLGAA